MFFRTTVLLCLMTLVTSASAEQKFAGVVSSASPEATVAGVRVLERGGNAIDAAIATSLALAVSEPAGSGIGGQTVILVKPAKGEPYVIHGTTWSPAKIPAGVTKEQLKYGRTASTVPSTLKVLDLAHQRFGSGNLSWQELVKPAIDYAENGIEVGPFRHRAFRFYSADMAKQAEAASIFLKPDGGHYQIGETFVQPKLANTLRLIARRGAEDFYTGELAQKIARDMQDNGGWITLDDLNNFPQPRVVSPLKAHYRGHEVLSLPPPFGGWIALQILNVLELAEQKTLSADNDERRLALLDAIQIGHSTRKYDPVNDFIHYADNIDHKIAKQTAEQLLAAYKKGVGGETTHFSIVDGEGTLVAVTQSIDSYFGAKVVHPELGFLYNNYMQSFRLDDPDSIFALKPHQMPLSSMSATIVSDGNKGVLALGSPGSARIISAVAQVSSYWLDVKPDIVDAVSAYRVHVVPDFQAYVEGDSMSPNLLQGMAERGMTLKRPAYGVSESQYDPYFGGVHAVAFENGQWTGAADPRRDGTVGVAWRNQE